jgi:hypothetical protein
LNAAQEDDNASWKGRQIRTKSCHKKQKKKQKAEIPVDRALVNYTGYSSAALEDVG